MKKLRLKIVFGVFVSALAVFLLTITVFGLSTYINLNDVADTTTAVLVKNNGKAPYYEEYQKFAEKEGLHITNYDAESPYRMRYFYVTYANNSAIPNIEHIASVNEIDALDMANAVKKTGSETGYYNDYRYRVTDSMVVFVDNSKEILALRYLLILIGLIFMGIIIMITLVFYFLSKRIVQPFEENARMQKQFITDASHELKTPLAIISANAEVLAYKDGENEWIHNITTQVTRVSELVNELLTLNRLEEVDEISGIEPVNLSEKTEAVAVTFEEVFQNKNAALRRRIQPGVVLNGNPEQLERLLSVLIENASKYVSESGEAVIELKKEARHTLLTVFNTCSPDPDADYTHLFDRFYRPDSSRTSQAGGHGIGLSIAKRIVTLHGGTIEAIPSANGLSFRVKLSNKLKPRK